jgi:hypothetical protein
MTKEKAKQTTRTINLGLNDLVEPLLEKKDSKGSGGIRFCFGSTDERCGFLTEKWETPIGRATLGFGTESFSESWFTLYLENRAEGKIQISGEDERIRPYLKILLGVDDHVDEGVKIYFPTINVVKSHANHLVPDALKYFSLFGINILDFRDYSTAGSRNYAENPEEGIACVRFIGEMVSQMELKVTEKEQRHGDIDTLVDRLSKWCSYKERLTRVYARYCLQELDSKRKS